MKRIKQGMLALMLSTTLFASVFAGVAGAETATKPSAVSQDGSEDAPQPRYPIKDWVYEIRGKKLYKRLWNYTLGEWEGDWIYVQDVL